MIDSEFGSLTFTDENGNTTHFPRVELLSTEVGLSEEDEWFFGKYRYYPRDGPMTWTIKFQPTEPYTITLKQETREEKRRRQIREFYPKQ